jgi:hypothetical protein
MEDTVFIMTERRHRRLVTISGGTGAAPASTTASSLRRGGRGTRLSAPVDHPQSFHLLGAKHTIADAIPTHLPRAPFILGEQIVACGTLVKRSMLPFHAL